MKHYFIVYTLFIHFFCGSLYSQDSIFDTTESVDTMVLDETVADTLMNLNMNTDIREYSVAETTAEDKNGDLLIPSIVFGVGIFLMLCLAVFSFTALSIVVMAALGILPVPLLFEFVRQSYSASLKKTFFFLNVLICSLIGALSGYLVNEGYSYEYGLPSVFIGFISGLLLSIPLEILLIFSFRRLVGKLQGLSGKGEE